MPGLLVKKGCFFLASWCGNFRCCFVSATATIFIVALFLLFSFLPQLKVKIRVFYGKRQEICLHAEMPADLLPPVDITIDAIQ